VPEGVVLAQASVGGAQEALYAARTFAAGEVVLPPEPATLSWFAGGGDMARLRAFRVARPSARAALCSALCRPHPASFISDPMVLRAIASARAFAEAEEGVDAAEEAECVCALLACAFNAHESEGGRGAVYVVAAKLQHSCTPNVEYRSALKAATGELVATHIALRPIAIGEELTISYLNLDCAGRHGLYSGQARRALLLRTKRFLCACDRCSSEPETFDAGMSEEEEAAAVAQMLATVARVADAARAGPEAWGGGLALAEAERVSAAVTAVVGAQHWAAQRALYCCAEASAFHLHVLAASGSPWPESPGAAITCVAAMLARCEDLWLAFSPPSAVAAAETAVVGERQRRLLAELHAACAGGLLAVAEAEAARALHPHPLLCVAHAQRLLLRVPDLPERQALLLQATEAAAILAARAMEALPPPPVEAAAALAEAAVHLTARAEGRSRGRALAGAGVRRLAVPLFATDGRLATLHSALAALELEAPDADALLVLSVRSGRLCAVARTCGAAAVALSAHAWVHAALAGADAAAVAPGAEEAGVFEAEAEVSEEGAQARALAGAHAALVLAGLAAEEPQTDSDADSVCFAFSDDD